MGFELMVFDEKKAPKDKWEFIDWYDEQMRCYEDHDYDCIEVSGPELQLWYEDMIKKFPQTDYDCYPSADMNAAERGKHIAEYIIGEDMIFVSFSWEVEKEALKDVSRLAEKYGLGYFEASCEATRGYIGDIVTPGQGRKSFYHDFYGR